MRRPIVFLTLLALIWGASFMLIKIADRQLSPATLILGRIGSAALLLAVIAVVRLGPRATLVEIRRAWGWISTRDRKSTRLNSSHVEISYAVFCLKKKKN